VHELSLARDALRKVEAAARETGGGRVVSVRMSLGALAGVSAAHLRRHFAEAARGTPAEGARLVIEAGDDLTSPDADALRIESVEIEE
jgi:hydrogenase nickel incorporation protein HypA/HybF